MKQRRVRGKWTINLCNAIRGWSAVSKCLLRQPSKSAVKRILQKKGMYPGQAFLFISRLPDSSGVSSTLYSTALCIFHIESPFMFYVRQLRGEQLCGRRILWKFRRRERQPERERENSFQWEKWSRMPNAPANKQELQTKALPQLLHYHNTRRQHLARCHGGNLKTDWQDLQVLILCAPWPHTPSIPPPQSSLSTSAVKSTRRLPCCCALFFQANLILKIREEKKGIFCIHFTCVIVFLIDPMDP